MNLIKLKNIFAAVSNKSILDPLLKILDPKSVKFWGTEGTVRYLKQKGFSATSVVAGFDFDGRLKSIDKKVFARILADRISKKHMDELTNLIYSSSEAKRNREASSRSSSPPASPAGGQGRTITSDDSKPFGLVVVDLYPLDKKNFPESMDIGGQALIRAAIKNYQNVVVAFDKSSLESLVDELVRNNGSTSLTFRKKQAKKAAEFIAERAKDESKSF